jgi:hypothetical protein
MLPDIGWVFIYVFAFGISDLIYSKLDKSVCTTVIYYLTFLLLGVIFLHRHKILEFRRNNKNKN